MKKNKFQTVTKVLSIIITSIAIVSCASISTPTGGPRDYTPPVYKKSNPSQNQTEVKSKKLTIDFDEVINRTRIYKDEERKRSDNCNLLKAADALSQTN
jgi:hypothetical protein